MATRILLLTLLAFGIVFTSCNKEDATIKPKVTIHELGQGDSHSNDYKATIGSKLHMDIEIVADGKIDYITIGIHPEEEDDDHVHDHEEWELDTTFTGSGISGLKNLDFHKDLSIDESAEAGKYHFYISVVDMEGNSSGAEAELELLEQPTNVTVTDLSINGDEHDVSKASGSFNITFTATAETGTLTSYSIEAHNEPENGEDEYKIIDTEFAEDFAGLTTATVNKTITVEPSTPVGEYHVEIIIKDSEGNEKVLEGHIELEE